MTSFLEFVHLTLSTQVCIYSLKSQTPLGATTQPDNNSPTYHQYIQQPPRTFHEVMSNIQHPA